MAKKARTLTPKQKLFALEYLHDFNATQAYRRAGYTGKGADRSAHALLRIPEVAAFVKARVAVQVEKAELSAARVLEELRRLAFIDMAEFFDEHGTLRNVHSLSKEARSALAGLEVIIKNAEAGDGHTDTVHKFKTHDKVRALEMLAKHFVLLKEIIQIQDDAERIRRLHRGRDRNAAAAKAAREAAAKKKGK